MADQSQTVLINRPPRIQPDLPQEEIEIPSPPELEVGSQSIIQMFLPLITIIGYVVVSASGQGRNLLMIVPMGLSVVASSALAFYTYVKNNRELAAKRLAYSMRLAEMRREMENGHEFQRNFYYYNYPNVETLLTIARNRENDERDNRSGTRLWERRTTDSDFGTVRLGIGTQPSSVQYTFKLSKNEEDPLQYEAQKLAEDSLYVTDVPILVSLRTVKIRPDDEKGVPGRHAIGMSSRDSARVYDVIRSMLVHFTAFHAPTDTRLYIFGAPASENNWNWARFVPHANSGNSNRPGDQLVFSTRPNDIETFWDQFVKSDLERRLIRLADDSKADVTLPFLLIIVDMLTVEDPKSPTRNIEAQEAISLIFRRGQELGATIIFLVPDPRYIPSQVETVIEIDADPATQGEISARGEPGGTLFRYTEIGVNTRRAIGTADTLSAETAADHFALKIRGLSVRSTFGTAGLPNSVLLLDLHDHIDGERVDSSAEAIWERWHQSREKENAGWLRVPIGYMPGPKPRDLQFSANGDGVHGMIAGTTGSGKSEMLITLILGLAMRYDPSVVNFVLVDYKGGSAFKMFERLPHVVNIVTSLQGNAGARTFVALSSEMKRRSKMLADGGTPHIVDYRTAGYHRSDIPLPPDSRVKPQPFPFLFVIIDEFAEMVKEMPQFRGELDSVTRLGRALGVSLILATQRPTGAVTDQMRANIKFKICLRVETPEDSRELLRSSDAAFLPTGTPGRAYLMVGNDNSQLMQVAYASYKYRPAAAPEDDRPPVIKWFDRPKKAKKQAQGINDPRSIADRVVEICAELARTKPDVVKQEKPWPDPLPVLIPLNAEYINAEMRKMPKVSDVFGDEEPEEEESVEDVVEYNPLLPINPMIDLWLKGNDRWAPLDWEADSTLSARIGMIDDPYHARQLPLDFDLKAGSIVVFGSAGKGKTGFLRTLATSLAAKHSPDALWIYLMDFGGGGLTPLTNLPHVGAIMNSDEGERIDRLINTLKDTVRERSDLFGGDSLATYNKSHPNNVQPAILVLLDNFAELRSRYEDLVPEVAGLLREGLAKGVYFAVTADQLGSVPGRLLGLFNQRMTLKLSETGDYAAIVGRVAQDLDDLPGRGYINIERVVLECQVAQPVDVTLFDDDGNHIDDSGQLAYLASLMAQSWEGQRPKEILQLESVIDLADIVDQAAERRIEVMLGVERRELKAIAINLKEQGPHFLTTGQPVSGKTTTLRTWILSLAHAYGPDRVAMVFIDSQRRLFEYADGHSLADLPHVRLAISEQNREQTDTLMAALRAIYLGGQTGPRPELFIFIDNYDDFGDLLDRKQFPELANLVRRYGTEGLHIVLAAGSPSPDDLFKVITRSKVGLALDAESAGRGPFSLAAAGKLAKLELPVGRGFVISSGRWQMVQIATPYPLEGLGEMPDLTEVADQITKKLDAWVAKIKTRWEGVTPWQFPEITEADASAAARPSGNGASSAAARSGGIVLPAAFAEKLKTAVKELPTMAANPAAVDAMPAEQLLQTAATFADMDLIDIKGIAAETGVTPEQVIDALVLAKIKREDASKLMGIKV